MEVPGRAPDGARARIGAPTRPVPVRSPGPPESAADRRSGPLSALAEEPFERVVRLAAMVLDAPQASVKVPGKRCSPRRTCPASTRAAAQRKTLPSVILAARNQTLLNWVTDDQRFLTAIHAITPALNDSGARDGRPARVRGRLAGRSVTAVRADNTHSNHDAVPAAGDGSCFRPQWAMLTLDRPVRPAVRW